MTTTEREWVDIGVKGIVFTARQLISALDDRNADAARIYADDIIKNGGLTLDALRRLDGEHRDAVARADRNRLMSGITTMYSNANYRLHGLVVRLKNELAESERRRLMTRTHLERLFVHAEKAALRRSQYTSGNVTVCVLCNGSDEKYGEGDVLHADTCPLVVEANWVAHEKSR